MQAITKQDRAIIRDLAKQQAEIAASAQMEAIRADWQRHSMAQGATRPMVTIELDTFEEELLPPMQRCTGEEARRIERALLHNITNHVSFGDDTVVNGFFDIQYPMYFEPFGIPVTVEKAADGQSLGHHFKEVITDLGSQFALLGSAKMGVFKQEAVARQAFLSELFGDILPVRITGRGLGASPTQNIVHIMSMETMYFSMYDYPDAFQKMMSILTADYLRFFRMLEDEDALLPTTDSERVGQGTYAYTEELPDDHTQYCSTDLWGYMDSQETAGISADMYQEFIFPHYQKIAAQYGLLSYGCCEAVDPIWDSCLSQLPNLRRVSISPWCDERFMGERLRGSRIIYHRKPSPGFIGVDQTLDEAAARAHIRSTIQAAKGCTVEFTQRDVYTVHKNPDKVRRYVEIIREEAELLQ